MIRLFIALKIPDEIKNRLTDYCRNSIKNYNFFKWEQNDKIHLTLKFIGDFDESRITELINILSFINESNSFSCKISRLGFFYSENEPRILWAGMEIEERLYELVNKLNVLLEKFNIKPEKRKFKPHITLLRIKNKPDKEFIDSIKNIALPELNFSTNKISLIKSTLTGQGSVYQELKVFELK